MWIGGLAAFLTFALLILAMFRAVTRNFVSKEELKTELLTLKDGIKTELDGTRHTLRNEMQSGFMKWDLKIDTVTAGQASLRESMARIEAILYVRGGHEPKNH